MAQAAQRGCAVSFLSFLILDWKKPQVAQSGLSANPAVRRRLDQRPAKVPPRLSWDPTKAHVHKKHSILNLVSIASATKAHILLPQLHNTPQTHTFNGKQLIWKYFIFLVSLAMMAQILPCYSTICQPPGVHVDPPTVPGFRNTSHKRQIAKN